MLLIMNRFLDSALRAPLEMTVVFALRATLEMTEWAALRDKAFRRRTYPPPESTGGGAPSLRAIHLPRPKVLIDRISKSSLLGELQVASICRNLARFLC